MKILFALGWLAFASIAQADGSNELLQNSDFSSGLTHWSGDVRPLNVALNTPQTSSGAAVELLDSWSKMNQDFQADKGTYTFSVMFTLAPGATFSSNEKDYRKIPGKLGFTAFKEFRAPVGDWVIFVTDVDTRHFFHCQVKPSTSDSTVQTVTGTIDLEGGNDDQTFCLAFPPGHGVITLQKISLTRK
jgi:hypothetical protein